jgi:hypothetical protein
MIVIALFAALATVARAQTPIGLGNCSLIPDWESDPLETRNEAVLDVTASGFPLLDQLQIVFYNPNKWTLERATIFSINESLQCGPSPNNVQLPNGELHAAECYNQCTVTSSWTDFMAGTERFVDDSNPAETQVRGKLHTNNTEIFHLRDTAYTRPVVSEFPFEITFPTTVTADLNELEVFLPPALDALLTLQSVDVDLTNLDVDGRAQVVTSLQWPFRFKKGQNEYNVTISSTKNNAAMDATVQLITDCSDPGVVDDSAGDNGNVRPCNQLWEIQLTPGASTCELDGVYRLDFLAECQPAFSTGGSKCPLVGPSGSLENNGGYMVFALDSEYFCPELIEEVSISAGLSAFKDAQLTVPATNFLLGQDIWFLATVTSTKVTLVDTRIHAISIAYGNSPPRTEYSVEKTAACANGYLPIGSSCRLVDFAIDNTGASVAQFNFKLTDPPFEPPVDGSQDFQITVLIDVQFEAVQLLENGEEIIEKKTMLLQASSETAARRATAAGNLEWQDLASSAEKPSLSLARVATVAAGAAGILLAA